MTPIIRKSDKCPYCGSGLSIQMVAQIRTAVSYTLTMFCSFMNCETMKQSERYTKTITRYGEKDRRSP